MDVGPHSFDPERSALVLIECQNEWLADDGLLQAVIEDLRQFSGAQDGALALLGLAREAGIAVAHAGLSFQSGHPELGPGGFGLRGAIKHYGTFRENGHGSAFAPGFEPVHGEFIVRGRTGSSAFAGSNLDRWLRNNGIDTVILAGFALHVCVESTLRAAHDLGYLCYLAKDATAAFTARQKQHVLDEVASHFGRTVSNAEIHSLLQPASNAAG